MRNKKNYIYIMACLYLVLFGFKTIVFANTLECEAWGQTLEDFQNLFNFCKIVVPLLVIGFSVFDFIKAVAGKDEKDLKKAFTKFMKRLALAVVFFFLPVLLNFLLKIFGTNSKVCIELR